jgi:recombination protein RecA
MFGSPETTTGGRALKFYSSIRLDVRRISDIKDGDHIIGHRMKAKAVKNKVATPKKETELDLYYPGESDITGFDKMGDLVNYGVANGVVEKSGAWYSYKTERIGQGVANAAALLRDTPEMAAKIVAQIKAVREKNAK